MRMKPVLIFGSSGFIGKRLVGALEKKLTYEITTINRRGGKFHGTRTHEYALESFDLANQLELNPESTVVNLRNAYSTNLKLRPDELSVNLFHPLEIAAQLSDRRQIFLQVGTYFEELEIGRVPFTYAWAKRLATQTLLESESSNSFTFRTVKLFDVYGERDYRPKLMNFLANHFKKDIPELLELSCPRKRIYPVHVEDSIDAIISSIHTTGCSFYAAPNCSVTLHELVEVFRGLSNRDGNIRWNCSGFESCNTKEILSRHIASSGSKISLVEGINRMLKS